MSARTSLQAWTGALQAVSALAAEPDLSLPKMLKTVAGTHGARPALIGPDRQFSYAELAARCRAVAAWARAELGRGTVGLLLPNGAEHVSLWLGLTGAGLTVALLNHNLEGDSLAHSIRAGGCEVVIADPRWAERVSGVRVITADALRDLADGGEAVATTAGALLIYTSGTTGLPKAARVSPARVAEWALWFAGMLAITPEDRIYDCLPLYHSTGGIVAIGAALVRGASVRISVGFSARRFWDEVTDGGCTVMFHIGELCRYLLAAPPHPREREHVLRLACGNGLQADVWERFQARFAVPQIIEFYAATEGSISLYNCEGKPGAIGRVPPFLRARFPIALVRVDPESGEPLRGADGLCVPCGDGEAGEALGRVDRDGALPARRFDGYTDAAATARKLLGDVLAPGDCWFRSGDLMRRDAAGFFYFVDRMGDTYRWKGENVSASEITAAVRGAPGVADAVVYGVHVPGHEGRAGMAAVVPGPDFAPEALWSHLARSVPAYAQPVFVRLCGGLDLTGTLKLSSVRLAQQGYAAVDDPVLVSDREARRYVPLTPAREAEIGSGARRL